MREGVVVVGGVLAGVLLALWFSTVVALGPAPGHISPTGKAQEGQDKSATTKDRTPPSPNKPHAAEHEAYCKGAEKPKDCIIALRNAEAAERQADFAKYSFFVTVAAVGLSALGLLLIKWTLDATRDAVAEAEKSTKTAQASVEQAALAAEQQAADMKESLRIAAKAVSVHAAAERPHLLLTELQVSGLLKAPNQQGLVELTLAYQFQNFGRSPAFLRGIANRVVSDVYLPADPTYPEATVVPHIVAPVNGVYGRPPSGGLYIPRAEAEEIAGGRRSLRFYGRLRYEDVLGEPHVIRYCYRVVFQGKDVSIAFRPDGPVSYWEYK